MPRIFDNIEQKLLPALEDTLALSYKADFCVGFFNLRGWKRLDSYIENWPGGEEHCCRLLVGMQRLPQEGLRDSLSLIKQFPMDNQTALKMKKKLAEEFRTQLTFGMPTNEDEASLRRLARQIQKKKLVVKLFLRHTLHAKLYLLFRSDPINPIIGYLGSSNLTLAGLADQGELNIDVLDLDACQKLAKWFEDRWNDRWCVDISQELVEIIEESWAREKLIEPYHIYIKMAYHLSREARTGLAEFHIPRDFGDKLFEFQKAAVKIAAHHLNKRSGVLIGDVVGLGKTLMATALVRILEEDYGFESLILCPKNLVKMWEDYQDKYHLHAKVLSLSRVTRELPELRRYKLLVIDESHHLRNRNGKRYRAIHEYILENESKVILLSATPYNKTYLDLSSQLRLFIPENKDLGIRPENLLRELGESEFLRRYQCPIRSLSAFEKSEYPDDWRELMRLYLIRRTRSFIKENYAQTDEENGRKFLVFENGERSYFPQRIPKTIQFEIDEGNPKDQYARLYAQDVVDTINDLNLPRYGLGNYIAPLPHNPPTQEEAKQLDDLSRAGKRLMGFCRTNLFKRLESSGHSFLESIERHILRNYIFLHAIHTGKPLPIGTQDAGLLDTRFFDQDVDDPELIADIFSNLEENGEEEEISLSRPSVLPTESYFQNLAASIYSRYASQYKNRFKWLGSHLFISDLTDDLMKDAQALIKILEKCGTWDSGRDTKLKELHKLLSKEHTKEKIIVFSQFADTVNYLERELKTLNVANVTSVTGESLDPTLLAWRFSPESNQKRGKIKPEDELRILLATDVLSEGQNLQDCALVVNYDLPWAIIRLIQRVGRVDRIGQKAESIVCYSFLPADGVERIIRLRARVRQRLTENAEVVGTDESFFEDDGNNQTIVDLYHEKSELLDDEEDSEIDLSSYAYQIWKNAVTQNPALEKIIPQLPPVVYATKSIAEAQRKPEGVLVYARTAEGNDALSWIDSQGKSVTQSQFAILKAAECSHDTSALPRMEKHHELVRKGLELILADEKSVGGQLGRSTGARFRTYERLKRYAEDTKGTLFASEELPKILDDIYRYPLRESAIDTLNRQLKSGISDETLAELVLALHQEDRLCLKEEEEGTQEPKIICSMGLVREKH